MYEKLEEQVNKQNISISFRLDLKTKKQESILKTHFCCYHLGRI